MRILMLNYEYPPLGGGAGVCTKYEAEGLARLGHKVTVVTTWFNGEKEIEEKGDLKIIRLKSKRAVTHKSSSVEKLSWGKYARNFLKDYCKSQSFDICIANFTMPGGQVALFLKKKFSIPYIIISHGHDIPWFFPKQMFFYHILTYPIIKKVCNNADKIVVLTSEMKENADKFTDSRKVVVIPNGCNVNQFKPDYKKKSRKFKILFVGRLTEQKDPMTFLRAIKEIKDKINFEAHVLGDGPLRQKMETYSIKHNLPVSFLGWVSKAKMLEEYQSASIQVSSSIAEAMSIAILESLSAGLFIISTPVSGNTDMIQPSINGDFFDFHDSEELAGKITEFYNSKFKKRYAVPASFLNQFRKKYDWGNIVKIWGKLVREVRR